MTAFDNIKTNNWPSTSNDLEDFLVLELPLNDQAALTSSSRDIVAGSKVLHPKKTLTNTGVLSQKAGPNYSDNSTGGAFYSTYTWADAFDGALNTGPFVYSTTTNTLTLPAGVTWSYKIRVHALRYAGEFEINGTDILASHTITNTAAWYDLTATLGSSGTLSTIMIGGVNTNYMKLMAVELDDTILVNPPGGIDKHYNFNAKFDGSTTQLTVPADPSLNLTGDFTIEAWTYQDANQTNGTILGTGGYYSGSNGGNWVFRRSSATQIAFATYDGTGNAEYNELSASTSLDTWHHIALVRSGTSVQIYVDGVAGGSMTVTKGLEDGANNGLIIGNAGFNARWNGKLQDIRIYNGVAKYTANFTPPGAILG